MPKIVMVPVPPETDRGSNLAPKLLNCEVLARAALDSVENPVDAFDILVAAAALVLTNIECEDEERPDKMRDMNDAEIKKAIRAAGTNMAMYVGLHREAAVMAEAVHESQEATKQ